jgi:hypothetical protein
MPAPILFAKLYIPPTRPKVVLRPRLIERLNEGLSLGCKLVLISAPAGFGKTTLVSEWLADPSRRLPHLPGELAPEGSKLRANPPCAIGPGNLLPLILAVLKTQPRCSSKNGRATLLSGR